MTLQAIRPGDLNCEWLNESLIWRIRQPELVLQNLHNRLRGEALRSFVTKYGGQTKGDNSASPSLGAA